MRLGNNTSLTRPTRHRIDILKGSKDNDMEPFQYPENTPSIELHQFRISRFSTESRTSAWPSQSAYRMFTSPLVLIFLETIPRR